MQQAQFREKVAEAMEALAMQLDTEHGVRHRLLVSGEGSNLRFAVKFDEPHKSGVSMLYRELFKAKATEAGLDRGWLDKSFLVGEGDEQQEWAIVGLNPRARANPVLVQHKPSGEIRKATSDLVKQLMA